MAKVKDEGKEEIRDESGRAIYDEAGFVARNKRNRKIPFETRLMFYHSKRRR